MYVHQTYVCSQIKNRIDAVTIFIAGKNKSKKWQSPQKLFRLKLFPNNVTTFLMWDRKEVIDLRISRRTINLKEIFL